MAELNPLNRDQVAALYTEHHGWLIHFLRKKLGCAAQAADLAQDTFMRALTRDLSQLREPRAWLTTVARGILVNWYQRQALEKAWLETLASLPAEVIPSPEESHLLLETLQEIDALLDALPERVRRVFLLSQIEGLTYAAIAERMQVSLATIKRDMKQAMVLCLSAMGDLPV